MAYGARVKSSTIESRFWERERGGVCVKGGKGWVGALPKLV